MTSSELSLIALDPTRTVSGWVITPGDTRWDEPSFADPGGDNARVAFPEQTLRRLAVKPGHRPADVLHISFPRHLTAAGTEAVEA